MADWRGRGDALDGYMPIVTRRQQPSNIVKSLVFSRPRIHSPSCGQLALLPPVLRPAVIERLPGGTSGRSRKNPARWCLTVLPHQHIFSRVTTRRLGDEVSILAEVFPDLTIAQVRCGLPHTTKVLDRYSEGLARLGMPLS